MIWLYAVPAVLHTFMSNTVSRNPDALSQIFARLSWYRITRLLPENVFIHIMSEKLSRHSISFCKYQCKKKNLWAYTVPLIDGLLCVLFCFYHWKTVAKAAESDSDMKHRKPVMTRGYIHTNNTFMPMDHCLLNPIFLWFVMFCHLLSNYLDFSIFPVVPRAASCSRKWKWRIDLFRWICCL